MSRGPTLPRSRATVALVVTLGTVTGAAADDREADGDGPVADVESPDRSLRDLLGAFDLFYTWSSWCLFSQLLGQNAP